MKKSIVNRYIAGPGTGKTHTLLELVRREAIEYDTKIGDIVFSTFARTQASDVRSRIGSVFPKASKKEMNSSVATIHAIALRSCKAAGIIDNNDRIIDESTDRGTCFFKEFADHHHLPYDPGIGRGQPDDDSRIGKRDIVGNTLFKIARYIQAQGTWEWSHTSSVLASTGMYIPSGYGDATELLQSWADYKTEHHLFEHDDYIRAAIRADVAPIAPIQFWDEFQDLSPLQYLLFDQWRQSNEVERIYIAGDPNQAIYAFRGSTPTLLSYLPGPIIDIGVKTDGTAPISRRCPPEIVAVADRVIGCRSNMTPRAGTGMVAVLNPCCKDDFVTLVAELQRKFNEVIILSRYRRSVRKLSKILTAAGLPHSSLHADWSPPWEKATTTERKTVDIQQLLSALDALLGYELKGTPGTITQNQTWTLINAGTQICKPPYDICATLKRPEAVLIPEILSWFSDSPPRKGITNRIASRLDFHEEINRGILAALNRGPSRSAPAAIALGTIHSAKGLGRPAVILHTEYNKGREAEYWRSPEMAAEERRVYYVGCTRASECLVILDGLRSGPSAPPLRVIPGVRA